MILNKNGETFDYEGKMYTVGEFIYVNENSDYEGLFGVIKEIRDGEDKDTDNDTPDIYCSFENPVMPYDIRRIEDRFSALYGEKKTIDDLALDEVIMAPEEISVVHEHETQTNNSKVFLLIEDWATDDDEGENIEVYSSREEALLNLRLKVREEYESGLIAMWLTNANDNEENEEDEEDDFDGDIVIDSNAGSYEAYLKGFYCSSHYSVSIQEKSIYGG